MPQDTDAANLFDDDVDVEIASIRSQRSRHVSTSEASRPPTSDSEGMFDHSQRGNSSGEEDLDNDSEDLPVNISISSRKAKEAKSAQVSIHDIIIMFKFYRLSSPSASVNAMLN
jgi:hypothetical protein